MMPEWELLLLMLAGSSGEAGMVLAGEEVEFENFGVYSGMDR